ncbi:MAG TPA: STAS domain-containing protein [Miltoncostaea sp.]|nr:STAS domain-containing protein [Miltoncostaea sp.]
MSTATAEGRPVARAPAVADPDTPLAVHITHDDRTVSVRVSGALSGARVPLLESVVFRLEKRHRVAFVLDLRDVAVTDAAGAALVRRFEERALRTGRSVSVLTSGRGGPPEQAR